MRVFFSLRWMGIAMLAVTVSSMGCQTTKLWPQSRGNSRTQDGVGARSAAAIPGTNGDDATAASLQAASAKIDQASRSSETEPPSYYAARNDSASTSSSAKCTSGCCR